MDGTVIELKNNYGVAPSYSIVKRVDGTWQDANNPNSRVMDYEGNEWREYDGDVESYVDPTGGRQNDMNYWRAAVAVKHPVLAPRMELLMRADPVKKCGIMQLLRKALGVT
jgi:hypothetical protein